MTETTNDYSTILDIPKEEKETKKPRSSPQLKDVWVVLKKTPNTFGVEAVLASKKDLETYNLTPKNEYMDRDRNQNGRWAVQAPVTY